MAENINFNNEERQPEDESPQEADQVSEQLRQKFPEQEGKFTAEGRLSQEYIRDVKKILQSSFEFESNKPKTRKRAEEKLTNFMLEEFPQREVSKIELAEKVRALCKRPTENRAIGHYLAEHYPRGHSFRTHYPRISDLYNIAALFKGEPLSVHDTVEDFKSAVAGKKILVLGDDIGSLSEELNNSGAQAFGIEYDRGGVLLAHSGALSSKGNPQDQVLQGDIGDLTDSSSELFNTLRDKGPFDLIFSNAVFNYGSGIERAKRKYNRKNKIDDSEDPKFIQALNKNSIDLLGEKGICLHEEVDMDGRRAFEGFYTVGAKKSYHFPIKFTAKQDYIDHWSKT